MSAKEAAVYLGVHVDTLYRYADNGEVPGFKLGGRWRFRVASLEEFMRKEESAGMRPGRGRNRG